MLARVGSAIPLTNAPAPANPGFRPAFWMFLRGYKAADLPGDLVGGVVVGLVAITLSIPFAMASGVGANAPQVGLVTVVVAGGMAALFGGSRLLVTGPTGGFIVVLASIAQRIGFDGLLAATMLGGIILIVAGSCV